MFDPEFCTCEEPTLRVSMTLDHLWLISIALANHSFVQRTKIAEGENWNVENLAATSFLNGRINGFIDVLESLSVNDEEDE